MASASDRRRSQPLGDLTHAAGQRLLETYAGLAQRKEHLLGSLLEGESPRQWRHYPEDDAIDAEGGYQWFYHSHSPEDRPDAAEHGHFHLFARRNLWARRLRSAKEREFAKLAGGSIGPVGTRHLIGIGLDAKGIPTSLFTVNSWVTGDLMLSAANTALLLEQMVLNTGFEAVDAVLESVIKLHRDEICQLLAVRDAVLFRRRAPGILLDERFEVLSGVMIDWDHKLAGLRLR